MTENLELPPIPDKNFFSIGEVSRIVQLPSYVLRYWESQFKILRPLRRSSGQRKFMKKDIEVIFQVRDLLYNKKFTIAGAKKWFASDRRRRYETTTLNVEGLGDASTGDGSMLKDIKQELEDILEILKK